MINPTQLLAAEATLPVNKQRLEGQYLGRMGLVGGKPNSKERPGSFIGVSILTLILTIGT